MQNLKHKALLKSFRFRILVVFLLIVLAGLFYFLKVRSNSSAGKENFQTNLENDHLRVNLELRKSRCSSDIDSILYTFGIKKEWISTLAAGERKMKPGTGKSVKEPSDIQWFTKRVTIPKDLTSAEVNLDISQYIASIGLTSHTNEEIRTTAVDISVYDPLDSVSMKNNTPLARITVIHDDKIKRDRGTAALILNRIGEYKPNELEELLNTPGEFSYIFPRNTDEIDLQNKLLQLKKDVIVQLTVGNPDNPEADFRIEMDDKEIKQRVKSINSDFPTIKNIILSKHEPQVPYLKLFPFLRAEFSKYNVSLFADTIIKPLFEKQEEDSKDRVNILAGKIKSLASSGKLAAVLTISFDELKELRERISILKKLGYKFCTFGDLIEREQQLQKEKQAETRPDEKPDKKEPDKKPKQKKK